MKKEMLINVLQPEECRIAILEDGVLEELYVERTSHESYVGNIYKGRIVNIEPSIQAAFVDFGVGRNGFLHVSDVEPAYYRDLEQRRSEGRGERRGHDRDGPGTRPGSRSRAGATASRAVRTGRARAAAGVASPPRGREEPDDLEEFTFPREEASRRRRRPRPASPSWTGGDGHGRRNAHRRTRAPRGGARRGRSAGAEGAAFARRVAAPRPAAEPPRRRRPRPRRAAARRPMSRLRTTGPG